MKISMQKISDTNVDWDLLPLEVGIIPNYMGINLCSVEAVSWTSRDDGGLISFTIHFIPHNDGEVGKDGMETTIYDVVKDDGKMDSPIRLNAFTDKKDGLNISLKSVAAMSRTKQHDGQLVSLTIHFDLEQKEVMEKWIDVEVEG